MQGLQIVRRQSVYGMCRLLTAVSFVGAAVFLFWHCFVDCAVFICCHIHSSPKRAAA